VAAKDKLGRAGEDRAVEHLSLTGYVIIERNWRCRIGEIDIIATRGEWLVFVEVKTRSTTTCGHPFEAVTTRKLQRMRRLAAAWCDEKNARGRRLRLDVIAVFAPPCGTAVIEHLEGVL
jgi:putative endonuclease